MTTDRGTPLPNMEDHACFGCGPANPSGLKMIFYPGDNSVCSWITVPEHLSGWNRLVHGGVVATILDEIMGRSILYLTRSLGMTKSMTIDFRKPVFVGQELKAEGRILEITNEREVRAEGQISNGDGQACARGVGVFTRFKPEDMQKKGMAGDTFLDFYYRHIDRS